MGKFIVLFVSLSAYLLHADLAFSRIFTDHAVLQQLQPIPVWGTATPGQQVKVTLSDQTITSRADSDGKWLVEFSPLKATFSPQTLSVTAAAGTVTLSDLLIGEVWICSGQSNMDMGAGSDPQIRKNLIPNFKNVRSFEVGKGVAFTEKENVQGKWVTHYPNSAVAASFSYYLEEAGNVPVGIILTCWGSTALEAWMPYDMVETVPHFKVLMDEFAKNTKHKTKIKSILQGPKPWPIKDNIFLRHHYNIVYNAMMSPLIPYACRGLVWYQGERNTFDLHELSGHPWYQRTSGILKYGDTLKKWVQRYRHEWQSDDMEFLIAMLPGYGKLTRGGAQEDNTHPDSLSWAWMREAQLQVLDLPHTAVACTIDLGSEKNIHPTDKLPVGKRLALLASYNTLQKTELATGPVMKSISTIRNTLTVHFDHAEGLKTTDGSPAREFWISDDSQQWSRAQATIKNNTVTLKSPNVSKPLYVRYAFTGKPNVNLVNVAGLPAYPFRTDSFPPLTK